MLRIVVIEKFAADYENLRSLLDQVAPEAGIIAVLHSLEETKRWFNTHVWPDLVITDTDLVDGNIFDLFENRKIQLPVIYTTWDIHSAKKAFQYNGIDYLIKPLVHTTLERALKKYFTIRSHFEKKMENRLQSILYPTRLPQRIIVRKGREYRSIRMNDIVCFYSKFKMIHVLTAEGKEFRTLKENLNELAVTLNPELFFKANRKYIVHIDYIKGFKILDFGRVLIELDIPVKEQIVVSQFSGMRFRKWIGENNDTHHLPKETAMITATG